MLESQFRVLADTYYSRWDHLVTIGITTNTVFSLSPILTITITKQENKVGQGKGKQTKMGIAPDRMFRDRYYILRAKHNGMRYVQTFTNRKYCGDQSCGHI